MTKIKRKGFCALAAPIFLPFFDNTILDNVSSTFRLPIRALVLVLRTWLDLVWNGDTIYVARPPHTTVARWSAKMCVQGADCITI